MVGKLAPNSSHLTRGLVKYVPGRDYFRAVPSQNGDKYVTSHPQSLNSSFQQFRRKAVQSHAFAFAIAFITMAISSSVGSIPRALATGCCGSPLECRNRACRIWRSAASGRIAHIFRGYAPCRAAVSLSRHGRTVIRPSSSPPAARI